MSGYVVLNNDTDVKCAEKYHWELFFLAGICTPVAKQLFSELDLDDFEAVVEELYQYRNARVVVIFLEYHHQLKLFTTVQSRGLAGHFIFIGGDELAGNG